MGNIEASICSKLNVCGEQYDRNDIQSEVLNEYRDYGRPPIYPPSHITYSNYNNVHHQQTNYNHPQQQYTYQPQAVHTNYNMNTNTRYMSNSNQYRNRSHHKTNSMTIMQVLDETARNNNYSNITSSLPTKTKTNSSSKQEHIDMNISKLPKSNIITKIDEYIDEYTSKMVRRKIGEIMAQNQSVQKYPFIAFPAPYDISNTYKLIRICITSEQDEIYRMPAIDEYFGDLNDIHRYDIFNKYNINNRVSTEQFANLKEAERWITDIIYDPLYQKRYPFNEWKDINLSRLGSKNQVLKSIFDEYGDSDISDRWLTIIAFSGFGGHRTIPMTPNEENPDSYFVNDTTFLSLYHVRDGYIKYGAKAYFDNKYCIRKIYISYNDTVYTPNKYTKRQWEHAKWVWKVSVTVATFLIDMVSHSRFRESSGLIKAIQETLNPNHPIRRLLLPFTFGTVYANRVYNEYLKKNGLFHRCFAFKYDALCQLIKDSMSNAPNNLYTDIDNVALSDKMKYRFRLFRKKIVSMKKLPDEIHPFYVDVWDFWVKTLLFVENYIALYYNDDAMDNSELLADTELTNFYDAIFNNLGILNQYKLKKFNIINILTHFINNATIWDNYLNSCISFECMIDPNFIGLKINNHNNHNSISIGNNIQNYVEYCLIVLSKGWKFMDFAGINCSPNAKSINLLIYGFIRKMEISYNKNIPRGIINIFIDYYGYTAPTLLWQNVLLNDEKTLKTKEIFNDYFMKKWKVNDRNSQRIVPFNAMNPIHFSPSIML